MESLRLFGKSSRPRALPWTKAGTPKEEIIRQYRSLKPCVHGSDAHAVASLFKPDNDRFCWVKSDPTFHGLRQILWEPEDRVHIGTLPPQPSDHSQQIRRISLSNSSGWFAVDSIELNSGLVAVIGEKERVKLPLPTFHLLRRAARWRRNPSRLSSPRDNSICPGRRLNWNGEEAIERREPSPTLR